MLDELLGVRQRFDCVVNSRNLVSRYAVLLNNRLARKIADAHDMVGLLHATFLDTEHGRIDIATRAVEIGSMDVNNQWLAADMLGEHTGRIGQPVVRMDDIEIQRVGKHGSYSLVVADLLKQIVGIAT